MSTTETPTPPASSAADLIFDVVKPGKSAPAQPATLTVGTLVVWRTDTAALHAVAARSKPARLDLLRDPVRPRLAVAARMMLRGQGEAFLDAVVTIRLTLANGEEQAVALQGQMLVTLLDMVPDGHGRLIDGNPTPRALSADGTRVVAYYLPQFYPFAVNDEAWGAGFTEWTNVMSARPNFPTHNMPLLPADLGFYDLRVADVRQRQAELAAQYGVDAFCYHYYWFSGRRVMQEGLDEILYSGAPSTDFCLCWANETWSRRWDGTEAEVLVQQMHDPAVDATLVADLLPYFADDRYLKVDGAPMLVIYRLGIMNEPAQVIAAWRAATVAAGYPGLFVVAARTFGLTPQQATLVDAVVEFPPHGSVGAEIQGQIDAPDSFEGKVYDYREIVINAATEEPAPYTCFPAVMPRWDNTARRGSKAHVFVNSTPASFQLWMTMALARAAALKEDRRFVFINSWNEWAEGAMLEPDRVSGRAYLEALRRARSGYIAGPVMEQRFGLMSGLNDADASRFLDGINDQTAMLAQMITRLHVRQPFRLQPGQPELVNYHRQVTPGGQAFLDFVSPGNDPSRIVIMPGQVLDLIGWSMMEQGVPHRSDRVAHLTFTDEQGDVAYHLPIMQWLQRLDVRNSTSPNAPDDHAFYGFHVRAVIETLPAGSYDLHMIQMVPSGLLRVALRCQLVRG